MLCILMKILSYAGTEKKTKKLKGFRFRTFTGRFPSDIVAAKGLRVVFVVVVVVRLVSAKALHTWS